jgi:methylenetetrahydrofolate--tRNA-(uracil-5-)-methyltransferase
MAGRNAARQTLGLPPIAPPRTTAMGALAYYVSHADARHYQPSNITFGIIEPLAAPPANRQERALAISQRALEALDRWTADAAPVAPR